MQKQGAPAVFDAPAPQYPIESVDNALKILLLLGERSELRLTDVAEYLNVATSTAHRLLAMLQYRGFVRQDPRTRAYRAGTALTGVAFSILERFDVRAVLHPFVESLSREFAETAHLALLVGASVRFVDAIESPQATRVTSRLGNSMPAHCTSVGKAMLAYCTEDELRRLYPDEELGGLTPNSIRTRSALEKELQSSPPPGLCDQQRGKRERDLLRRRRIPTASGAHAARPQRRRSHPPDELRTGRPSRRAQGSRRGIGRPAGADRRSRRPFGLSTSLCSNSCYFA